MFKGAGAFKKFWDETAKRARAEGKLPMLICKQNRSPVLLCVDAKGAIRMKDMGLLEYEKAPLMIHNVWIYFMEDVCPT